MKKLASMTSILWLFAACTQDTGGASAAQRQEDAQAQPSTAEDLCAAHGWYDDGTCDDWCLDADPDCDSEAAPTACGGLAGLPCPEGLSCVDDPNDDCDPDSGGADCIGICVEDTQPEPTPTSCGGFAGLSCPDGLACVDDPNDDCDPNNGGADCIGICVEATPSAECHVGGFGALGCTVGDCIDVPDDGCDGIDCPGVCRDLTDAALCAGIAGLVCSDTGAVCVDDPRDDCSADTGGADCAGVCVAL